MQLVRILVLALLLSTATVTEIATIWATVVKISMKSVLDLLDPSQVELPISWLIN